MNEFYCGFISIIGKTNAGKSSLLNSIIGEKVSIVSPKTQTTRDNILGIYNQNDCQLIFTDTPGIHRTKNQLDKYMMKNVRASTENVDLILYLIDSSKPIDDEEKDYIDNLTKKDIPIIIVLTKSDKCKKNELVKQLSLLGEISGVKEFICISNVTHNNIEELINLIKTYMPKSNEKNYIFPEDIYTDKSVRYLVGEIIREKLLMILNDEIPHGVLVAVTNFDETKNIVNISADIYCEKENHKNIIIGKNGQRLKMIGTQARQDIEVLLDSKVMLKLWVRAKDNWQNNIYFLNEFSTQ